MSSDYCDSDRLAQLGELDKRRESILKSLEERELLTEELKEKLLAAETMSVLEDSISLSGRNADQGDHCTGERAGIPCAMIFGQDEVVDVMEQAASFVDSERA